MSHGMLRTCPSVPAEAPSATFMAGNHQLFLDARSAGMRLLSSWYTCTRADTMAHMATT